MQYLSVKEAIAIEVALAEELCTLRNHAEAFRHLERAHVLGQSLTGEHTRVHWLMLKLAIKMDSPTEIWGQIVRIIGAATKTPFGLYPAGNTGGANVWFFKRMPIPDDLQNILDRKALKQSEQDAKII